MNEMKGSMWFVMPTCGVVPTDDQVHLQAV